MVRRAFSLIELIFTIVVLSIAFLAIPQLFESTTVQIEEIAKDEATFYGFKALQNVYRYYWDDKTVDNGTAFILDVSTNGDDELARLPGKNIGRGQASFGPLSNNRKFYTNITYATTSLGQESGETMDDDIDDFNNRSESTTSTLVDITSTIRVYYVDDNASYDANTINFTITPLSTSSSTNIKMIEVNVTDSNNDILLLYRVFACNIGTRTIRTRELP